MARFCSHELRQSEQFVQPAFYPEIDLLNLLNLSFSNSLEMRAEIHSFNSFIEQKQSSKKWFYRFPNELEEMAKQNTLISMK